MDKMSFCSTDNDQIFTRKLVNSHVSFSVVLNIKLIFYTLLLNYLFFGRANKLYDDMLHNWRQMNEDKKKREQAREER